MSAPGSVNVEAGVALNGEEEQAQANRTTWGLRSCVVLLSIAVMGLTLALVLLFGLLIGNKDQGGDSPPTFVPKFHCGFECVKAEALRVGADVLTPLDNLKYDMEVVYSAAEDSGEACGEQHVFPAFKDRHLDPRSQLKLTTVDTRETPDVIFQCTKGKSYHLMLNDCLGGAFQNASAYNHWVRLNVECPTDQGWARAADSGRDIMQGQTTIPGWFSGKGYLPPAFPYNAFHHFNFYLFETDAPFSKERVDQFDIDLPANNALGGGAWTIDQIMTNLTLQAPVGRTWMDSATSYWSHLRMSRINDYVENLTFYKIICKCNEPGSWPGQNKPGAEECNL